MKFDLSCLYKQLAPRFKKSWEASPKWIISHPKLTHMFLNAWLLSKDKQLIETYWSKNTSWTRITRRYTKRGNPRKPRSYGCTNARKMFAKGLRSKIILHACVNFTLVKRRKKLTNKHRSVHFQYETRKRQQMLHGWTRFLKMQKTFHNDIRIRHTLTIVFWPATLPCEPSMLWYEPAILWCEPVIL